MRVGDRRCEVVIDAGTLSIDGVQQPLLCGPDGSQDLHAALARLALAQGLDVRACGSCARFRFSGMSYQMSGGGAGYCDLVGFRHRDGVVSIFHGCGEHLPAEGWPSDLPRVAEARAGRHARPPVRAEAFAGAMLGLAIGDALGFPPEFRSRKQILAAFPPHGVDDFVALHDPRWPERPMILGPAHPPGTYSDDTQMTIALAEALLDAGRDAPLDAIMERVRAGFVRWSRSPANDRGPGSACMTGCANLEAGADWRVAGVADSKGCGSAMRVAPLGLLYARDRARLLEVARAQSLLTHRHDAGIEGAAAAALLVALALAKRTPQQMHEELMATCAPRSADLAACLVRLPALVDAPPEIALSKAGLGEGWVAEEAVASALYCFWRTPDDFVTTVLTAANTDGDSDSIACIAGGISGAFNGAAAIPARWRAGVEDADAIAQLAARLYRASVA